MSVTADPLALEQRGAAVQLDRRGRHFALWVMKRSALGLGVLWLVSVVVFGATQALPGDAAQAILGRSATAASLAGLREKLGLDHSLIYQYGHWALGIIHGDFGISLATGTSVAGLVSGPLVDSITLLITVAVIGVPLALLLGVWSAVQRDRLVDRSGLIASLVFAAVPEFVVGLVLVVVLSTTVFHWLPATTLIPPGSFPLASPSDVVLPVMTLVVSIMPYLYRLVRASMLEALSSDYVAMARMKGMPERVVVWRHALRNALIPAVQGTALTLNYLLGGIVVVEYVFRYPGLGTLLTSSISTRDLPVIQAVAMIFAAGVVVFNLGADFTTVWLTPRLRTRS